MPAVKSKTQASVQAMHSISAVRQLIRRLQFQSVPRKLEIAKMSKQKPKQSDRESYNLPVLQSHRSKNLPISEFKNVFSHHCQQLLSHRQGHRKFTNPRSRKHNQPLQSPRYIPQLIKKSSMVSKSADKIQQNEELIPWLKRFQLYKNSVNPPTQPINITSLFESKQKKERVEEGSATRRSKTEQKEPKRTLMDKFFDMRREIAPWEFQIARDTIIRFQ